MTENRDFFASPGQQQGKVLPKPIKMWFGFNGRWFDRYFPRIISEVGFIFWKLSCENNYCVVELIPWLEGTNTKHTRSWEIWELSDKRLFADYIYCSSLRLPRTKKQNNKHFNFNLMWRIVDLTPILLLLNSYYQMPSILWSDLGSSILLVWGICKYCVALWIMDHGFVASYFH